MTDPVHLYGLSRSVYTRIARLALEEKAVSYKLVKTEIFGAQGPPPEHWQRHPFGRIPALSHGALSLYETSAICRYVDEAFPGPSLQPTSPTGRARVTQLVSVLDSYVYRPLVWGVFFQRVVRPQMGEAPDQQVIDSTLPQVDRALQAIRALRQDARYLVGESLTLADLHAFPMLKCLTLMPEGQVILARNSSIEQWLVLMADRASVRRTRWLNE
ncbi:MAG: glutathione S-transferase family protein [Burkholderiaceae bacterium]